MRPATPHVFRPGPAACLAIAAGLGACLQSENVDLGRNVDAGAPVLPGVGLDAAPAPGVGVPVLTPVITSSAPKATICKGACTELYAVVSGAPGPYVYTWGQGLGEGPGPKTVCPAATTEYSVTVSSTSTEQQSTGSGMITVVPCDAGVASSPPPDAGVSPPPSDSGPGTSTSASLCLSNPSFEGTPMIGAPGAPGVPATAAPPQWQVCLGDPDVDPSVSLLPASNGKTYVGLTVATGAFSSASVESVGTTLCSPLQAGTHYSFCVDVGIGVNGVNTPLPGPGTPGPTLQFWGGTASCGQDELLWTSLAITNKDSWSTVCGTFVPSQTHSTLTLVPAQAGTSGSVSGTLSYVMIDNIVPGP